MKYSLNPLRWLLHLINRWKYRHMKWSVHYYISIPYTKRYLYKWLKELHDQTPNQSPKIQ